MTKPQGIALSKTQSRRKKKEKKEKKTLNTKTTTPLEALTVLMSRKTLHKRPKKRTKRRARHNTRVVVVVGCSFLLFQVLYTLLSFRNTQSTMPWTRQIKKQIDRFWICALHVLLGVVLVEANRRVVDFQTAGTNQKKRNETKIDHQYSWPFFSTIKSQPL